MEELIGLLYESEESYKRDRVAGYDSLVVAVERLKSGKVRARFCDWSDYQTLRTVPLLKGGVKAVYGRPSPRSEPQPQPRQRREQKAKRGFDLDREIEDFAARIEAAKAARGLDAEYDELTGVELDEIAPSLRRIAEEGREKDEAFFSGIREK